MLSVLNQALGSSEFCLSGLRSLSSHTVLVVHVVTVVAIVAPSQRRAAKISAEEAAAEGPSRRGWRPYNDDGLIARSTMPLLLLLLPAVVAPMLAVLLLLLLPPAEDRRVRGGGRVVVVT